MIGVLGGYGAVGREAVRLLQSAGVGALRVGGRRPQPVAGAESRAVDVTDAASLLAFADGCRLVVNCAAPSARLSPHVAATLAAAGIALVDAGGAACADVAWPAGARALFAAGALPGLSGALPLWLADSIPKPQRLHCWFGILDGFTAAGAEDYLDGALQSGSGGPPLRGAELPFFPRPLTLQPFSDRETRYVAARLGVDESRCWLVLEGQHLVRALEQARALPGAQAVDAIVAGSALDAAGRRPQAQFLIQLDGLRDGAPAAVTLRLTAPGVAHLTAACAAACALWLTEAAPTVGLAAEQVPADELIRLLRHLPSGVELEVFNAGVDDLRETSGGVL
ncbi:hypothetical protein QDZ74_004876 [Pluralibacter gergoviae]|uniref:hypothetical protein n=1 Tax=Pluralibacter gergoviae TaxID=61647 RepID=UPI0008DBF4EA|nr:hypothetical protein [Pluralibacter gergoviae]EKW6621160.1 hypothetical protein [Pluralibacter gergoviae]OHY69442.1 hypothetical protein BB778_09570 [Pluralibacter gergoviae]